MYLNQININKNFKLSAVTLTFLLTLVIQSVFLILPGQKASANSITPSTNAANKTAGWAYAELINKNSSSVTLKFVSTRNFYSCFEYRADGDISQRRTDILANPNALVTDGYYPAKCVKNQTTTVTVPASEYVDVRMVFGAENDERFDWTQFDVGSAAVLSSTIPTEISLCSAKANFNVSTIANDDLGRMVIGKATVLTGDTSGFEAKYKEVVGPNAGTYMPLAFTGGQTVFGPSTGFPVTDATSQFEVEFTKPGSYMFEFSLETLGTTPTTVGSPLVKTVKVSKCPPVAPPTNHTDTKVPSSPKIITSSPNAITTSMLTPAIRDNGYVEGSVAAINEETDKGHVNAPGQNEASLQGANHEESNQQENKQCTKLLGICWYYWIPPVLIIAVASYVRWYSLRSAK